MRIYGSKNRFAKELLSIFFANRQPGQCYVEPFCGGCNVIDKATGPRIAADVNPYLIAYLIASRDGWKPPRVSRELYREIRLNRDKFPKELVGFAGFCCSYKGRFFEGYAYHEKRDYQAEAVRNMEAQIPNLIGIELHCCDYHDLTIPENSIIYCDPPYAGRKKYGNQEFDYKEFWRWCKQKAESGHEVFVSEFGEAPRGWKRIWEKMSKNSLAHQRDDSQVNVEKLYKFVK